MNRRSFLTLGAASAITLAANPLGAKEFIAYTEGLVEKRLAAGETVFVDFFAPWCSTCRAQERAVEKLLNDNPAYGAMTFVRVDWDTYARGALSRRLKIPRRSTLVVLKGNRELGRIVADTRAAQIKALLDLGLSATTA